MSVQSEYETICVRVFVSEGICVCVVCVCLYFGVTIFVSVGICAPYRGLICICVCLFMHVWYVM